MQRQVIEESVGTPIHLKTKEETIQYISLISYNYLK